MIFTSVLAPRASRRPLAALGIATMLAACSKTQGKPPATAVPVVGGTRLYGITPDGRLAYVEERAHSDAELAPHASAALERLAG